MESFYETLPTETRERFLKQFYFATIDNRDINARIKRSNEGFYGVFIHSNLITAIHRLGKLELAMYYPEMVYSCSRYPHQQVTGKQMIEIYSEVYVHFLETKLPLGPQVLLKEPLNTQHLFNLELQEQLIIFHEVAHFLNGDLEKGANSQDVIEIFPNLSYQREHLADLMAFGLLLRQLKHHSELNKRLMYVALLATINLYKIQHLIQGVETEKYPHPLNRMAVILEYFYGKKTEEWVADAILNNKINTLTFDLMPSLIDFNPKIVEFIEQQLQKSFA